MSSAAGTERESGSPKRHAAGAFDVRNVIAGLIGLYGVVLVIYGLVDNNSSQKAKTGDVNANLWAGIVMVAVALAFFVWTRLRPIVVEPVADGEDAPKPSV
jgi:hypothetical protein